jgi:hypothetical protein
VLDYPINPLVETYPAAGVAARAVQRRRINRFCAEVDPRGPQAGCGFKPAIPLPFVGRPLHKIGGVLEAQVSGQQRSCKRNGKFFH